MIFILKKETIIFSILLCFLVVFIYLANTGEYINTPMKETMSKEANAAIDYWSGTVIQ